MTLPQIRLQPWYPGQMGVDGSDVPRGIRWSPTSIVLYVDDFGTGYSSLSRLRQFPVDYLKIDRSFIEDLQESENSRSIVRAIVLLAENLGLRAVAEGVVTTRHVNAWCVKNNIELPITDAVHKVLFRDIEPLEALTELMTRALRME